MALCTLGGAVDLRLIRIPTRAKMQLTSSLFAVSLASGSAVLTLFTWSCTWVTASSTSVRNESGRIAAFITVVYPPASGTAAMNSWGVHRARIMKLSSALIAGIVSLIAEFSFSSLINVHSYHPRTAGSSPEKPSATSGNSLSAGTFPAGEGGCEPGGGEAGVCGSV